MSSVKILTFTEWEILICTLSRIQVKEKRFAVSPDFILNIYFIPLPPIEFPEEVLLPNLSSPLIYFFVSSGLMCRV